MARPADRRGQEWAGAIDEHLNRADVVLLLVSADFLASDYCYDREMTRALERDDAGDARVIPVILRSVDWHGAQFAKLQALPKDARPVTSWPDRDEAFTDVARGIRQVRRGPPKPPLAGPSPPGGAAAGRSHRLPTSGTSRTCATRTSPGATSCSTSCTPSSPTAASRLPRCMAWAASARPSSRSNTPTATPASSTSSGGCAPRSRRRCSRITPLSPGRSELAQAGERELAAVAAAVARADAPRPLAARVRQRERAGRDRATCCRGAAVAGC